MKKSSAHQLPVIYAMRLSEMRVEHDNVNMLHSCHRCSSKVGIFPIGQDTLVRLGESKVEIVCFQCEEPATKITRETGLQKMQRNIVRKKAKQRKPAFSWALWAQS